MTDAWGSLHIEVVDGEIVVTAPFTSYTVTYYKPAKSPQLLAKRIASRDDPCYRHYAFGVPGGRVEGRQ